MKKLKLKKMIISDLNDSELQKLAGGETSPIGPNCPTDYTMDAQDMTCFNCTSETADPFDYFCRTYIP